MCSACLCRETKPVNLKKELRHSSVCTSLGQTKSDAQYLISDIFLKLFELHFRLQHDTLTMKYGFVILSVNPGEENGAFDSI